MVTAAAMGSIPSQELPHTAGAAKNKNKKNSKKKHDASMREIFVMREQFCIWIVVMVAGTYIR